MADRFGYDKLVLEVEDYKLIYDKEFVDGMKEIGISALLLKHVKITNTFIKAVEGAKLPIIF